MALYWQIRKRLGRMGDPDAGVLGAAYAPRPWPRALRRELGRLTGIVVRLASVDSGEWPEERNAQDVLGGARRPAARGRAVHGRSRGARRVPRAGAGAAVAGSPGLPERGATMKGRPSPPRLPLRALYTMAELVRATGVSRRYLRRALEERGVELFVIGGRPWVPLSEIVAKLKPLWDSVQASGGVEDEGDEGDALGLAGSDGDS